MYEKRFGLHRKPFQSVLTDHDFFQSETILEILPAVLHALKSDLGVAVLTGPSGVGKSVTLDHLRRSLESNCQTVLIRGGSVHSAADLLFLLQRRLLKCQTQDVETASPASSNVVRRWEVVERLERIVSFWGPLIVLLDDAHLVQPEVFAELRALLEEGSAGQKLLRLLIAGPLLLEEVLAEPNRVDFVQKIRTHVFLQPIRSSEAVAYLNHQLTCAGASLNEVMDSDAVERIVVAADGVPRCLNLLADESLMVCDEHEGSRVTRAIVDQALERLQHLPYAWNVSLHDTHEPDSIELDDLDSLSDSAASENKAVATNAGVLEIGVFEIGESVKPSTIATADVSETKPERRPQRFESVTIEGGVNSIEIGAPADRQDAEPTTPIDPVTPSCVPHFGGDSTTAGGEETQDDAGRIQSETVELGTTDDSFAEARTDQTAAESDSVWTATEVTADEFFQHQETLADFDESDDAVAWKSSATAPLFDHSTNALAGSLHHITDNGVSNTDQDEERIPEQPKFEQHGTHHDDADEYPTAEITPTEDTPTEDTPAEDTPAEDTPAEDTALAVQPAFEAFQPWQPAGTWPATAVARPAVIEAEPSATSVTPIFDRYTWCELGRSVSPSQWSRQQISLPLMASAQWPPLTQGIAPADRVPVVNLQDDYAELLSDLGTLINATADTEDSTQTAAASERADDAFLPGSDQDESYSRAYDHNPETALDRIQQLLESDRSESQQRKTEDSVGGDLSLSDLHQNDSQNADSNLTDDTGAEDAQAEDVESENVGTGDLLSFPESDSDDAAWSLVDDSASASDYDPLAFLGEMLDATQRPDPSSFDPDGLTPEGPTTPDDTPPSRDARGAETSHDEMSQDNSYPVYLNQVICDDDRDEWLLEESQLQNEDDDAQQQQYSPKLLRQARQRVATRSVHGGQLRHAAGAESVSAVTASDDAETVSLKPRLSISTVEDEEAEEQPATSETSETAANPLNFRNLFTRLRQRDKRA